MHIIGRGRYARETYPERSAALLGLLKVGYDQPTFTQLLADAPNSVLPRNATDPLQVQLLGVTPGNILEVDCTASINNTDDTDTHSVATLAAVNFDAIPAPFGPAAGWFVIELSLATELALPLFGEGVKQLRNFAGIPIPAGAVNATVQIVYLVDVGATLEIFGTDSGGPMTTLKASELSSLTVQQVGPASLFPV